MTTCPETLRSPGVAPKSAPVRLLAWATFERRSARSAIVEVTYLGSGRLYSCFRAEIGRNAPTSTLREKAYSLAELAAKAHGYELDRFSTA